MWVPAATNNKTESHGQQQKNNEQTGNISQSSDWDASLSDQADLPCLL